MAVSLELTSPSFNYTPFGPNRVYALDSNNGIIAMQLHSRLGVTQNGEQLRLTWSGGTLESSATVDGTYSEVSGATSPHDVDTSSGQQFFRVRE